MEDLQKSMTDLKALMEKMDATVSALAPLVPSVSALVALPTSVDVLQKTMKEAGTHLESVSVAVKRMEAGDRSSESSSAKQKGLRVMANGDDAAAASSATAATADVLLRPRGATTPPLRQTEGTVS